MIERDRAREWLARGWWLLMPPFGALALRFVFERTCAAPYQLLPWAGTVPLLAWLVAGLYVSSHLWIAAACVFTIERTGALVPTLASMQHAWRGDFFKVVLAGALFVLEYWPTQFWQAVGHRLLGCGG